MPKFKLAIGTSIVFPFTFAMLDGDQEKTFKATFVADRITEEEWRDESKRLTVSEVLQKRFKGWKDQNLIFNDTPDGGSADFSPEAFDFMLKQVKGLPDALGLTFVTACSAKAKN